MGLDGHHSAQARADAPGTRAAAAAAARTQAAQEKAEIAAAAADAADDVRGSSARRRPRQVPAVVAAVRTELSGIAVRPTGSRWRRPDECGLGCGERTRAGD